jgi:uncharacterized protein (TIGR02271 family)
MAVRSSSRATSLWERSWRRGRGQPQDRKQQRKGEQHDENGKQAEGGTQPKGQRDDAMTHSEDELDVHTARRPSELVRLKKSIVTENKDVTVPVKHEELRVEREPITDANRDRAMSGPDLAQREHDVTLHEEEVVVDKTVVPKERVRLDKDVASEERTVYETVRKEQVDVEREPRK